ncbi:MAG TPA: sulfatase [Luteolibacter sp.]|nr:sulfatase [Luteolibacter sp.]
MKTPTLFLSLLLGLSAATAGEKSPPNIVLILSDDQAWTDYGFMGHPDIETPRLDRLASESVTFPHGYVPTALCRPALASIATGLYAHQHGITGNDPAKTPANKTHAERSGKDPREILISNINQHPTLPRLLTANGYLAFQSGKWWEGNYKRGGFTHGMTRGYPETGGRHGDDGLEIGREGMEPVFDFMDTALEGKKPFFVWYAPFLPHTPHNPPERLLEKYRQDGRPLPVAKYYAMCEWFDETCGQLLDRIEQLGIADNTLVIYVTDNGWIQNPKANSYAPRSKRSPNEGGTRTPIMFRWKGKLTPAKRDDLCSSLDLMPTALAAAGINPPSNLPGINLLPHLMDGTAIPRDAIYGENFAHDIADVRKPEASLLHRWVIRGRHKLILTYDGNPGKGQHSTTGSATPSPQLYDLAADPHEKRNLAAEQPQTTGELTRLIQNWYPLQERKVNSLPSP